MSRNPWEELRQSTPASARVARRAIGMGIPIINITKDVRKCAIELGIAEETAVAKALKEKSRSLLLMDTDVYTEE